MAEYIEREATNADYCGAVNKIETPFAQIIVCGTAEKPYYNILYFDTSDGCGHIGFGSYCLDYVFKWLSEEFKITEDEWNVDLASVVRGKWIYHVDDLFPAESTQECSCCHEEELLTLQNENYCPNCGARMDGE